MTDAPTEPMPIVAADAAGAGGAVPGAPATAAPGAAAAAVSGDPASATPAAACRACSAPLAADQRYCLSCGARVAAPRVEWATALAAPAGAAGAAPHAAAGGAHAGSRWALMLDRIGGPMGAAAVVLVALGVGFLLGQGGGGTGGPATIIQRPPIVNVQGGGSAPAATSGTDASAGTGASSGSKSGGAKSGSGSTAGIPKATGGDTTGGDLNRLRAQPKEQATGGNAPKRDNKPSGGGSAAETIG